MFDFQDIRYHSNGTSGSIKIGNLTTSTDLVWQIGQCLPKMLSQCLLENNTGSEFSLVIGQTAK